MCGVCACNKAALNKASQCLSFELQAEDIVVESVHPGWVRTDMGTSAAPIEIEDSVRQIMDNVVLNMVPQHSGKLFLYDGTEMAL
jgi:NAD(P)-dependent dehydrogenase (short-subunit alcohol dehydrogenase family)